MRAFGEEAFEPRFGFRRGVRARDAEGVEAASAGLRGERCLDVGAAQKSRLA